MIAVPVTVLPAAMAVALVPVLMIAWAVVRIPVLLPVPVWSETVSWLEEQYKYFD